MKISKNGGIDVNINATLEALARNNMHAVFVESVEEAKKCIKEMLPEGSTVSHGGSITLAQSGLSDFLRENFRFIERGEVNSQTPDCYFSSSNAITETGVLYNVDGHSNRVSALIYGAPKVIIVAGINKIVKDLNEAIYRVKTVAAPKNCVRLHKNTYCAENGKCVSLLKEDPEMCDGCSSPDRICCNYTVMAQQRIKDRVNVIIINQELGY